ncbi:MAG TPA: response regulator [Planctomycetota bacterium]|nr:response regulator [Planctomycetota bacterium]
MTRVSTVLLVEDDPDQAFLLKRAFARLRLPVRLIHQEDGDGAIQWLERAIERRTLPALVILDVKLPRRSGLEVLEWIRQRVPPGRMPVVVLSSSIQRLDLERAYRARANAYYMKPFFFDALLTLVSTLRRTWLERERPAAPSRRILVVDDDGDTREILEAHLLSAGHEVALASDGAAALSRLREDAEIALVILDLRMPGIDGWSCLRMLRHDPDLRHLPVVALSGCAEEFAERPAEADAFVPKPIDPRRLLETVEEMLSGAGVG